MILITQQEINKSYILRLENKQERTPLSRSLDSSDVWDDIFSFNNKLQSWSMARFIIRTLYSRLLLQNSSDRADQGISRWLRILLLV